MCQMLLKSVYVNNSYSGFCEVAAKIEVSIFRNCLFISDSVHGLLGNFVINFLAAYSFFCFNSLI